MNMTTRLKIAPDLRNSPESDLAGSLPQSFALGKEIYSGRNSVRVFPAGDKNVVVKKYARCGFLKALGYLFHSGKARRAYKYGIIMLERGILTPLPIAYVETRRGPLIVDSYFVSEADFSPSLVFMRQRDFDPELADRLALYLLRLHQAGILHGDLNLTNILLRPDGNFVLIDTNRSKIFPTGKFPSRRRRLANIIRVTHRRDLLRRILLTYARAACEPDSDAFCRDGLRFLLRMEARKRFLHSFRKKKKK